MRKYNMFISVVFLFAIHLQSFSQMDGMQGSRPNIIYILLDDLGYSDIGCYGGEVRTPNIDRMAKKGMRLPQMCNGAICNITRTNLMTGKYSRNITPNRVLSLPESLKDVGYNTYMVGKSHLRGKDKITNKTVNLMPTEIGFDKYFGFLGGQTSMYINNNAKNEESLFLEGTEKQTTFPQSYYTTDACSQKAIEYINSNEPANNQPFFLYLAYQAPHVPIQAPAKDIAKYRGMFLRGWEAQREERLRNMKKYGIFDPEINTSEATFLSKLNWDNLTPAQRDLEDLRMAAYAAMVEKVDKGIGDILATLEANGELENTLILFSSDNGPTASSQRRYDVEKKYVDQGVLPSSKSGLWFNGAGWGYVNATPFSRYKSSNHAGGAQTGAIAYWPAQIKPEELTTKTGGAINKSLLHIVDFMPTCVDVAYPQNQAEKRNDVIKDLDGVSMISVFESENIVPRAKPVFFNMNDDRAIRTEKWSLVEHDRDKDAPSNWKLYDHRFSDPTELNDVSTSNKEVVDELEDLWMEWYGRRTYSPLIDTRTFSGDYRVIPMVAKNRGTKYGYLEAVGSDHLTNFQSVNRPNQPNKPRATLFRGSDQFVGEDNIGIDGYAVGLNLSDRDIIHKLVLKEQTPAVMRLDLFSVDIREEFLFEYVNVPEEIFVYSGEFVNNQNSATDLSVLNKVNSMSALKNANVTSWFWENGSAYLKYVAPSSYTYTSETGGFDNIYFCLNNNCVDGEPQPILISDYDKIDSRSGLVNKNNVDVSTITENNGSVSYLLTNNRDGVDGCVDYQLDLTLQNWVGAHQLNLEANGLSGSELFVKNADKLILLGELATGRQHSFDLNDVTPNQLNRIKALVIRTCESDFSAGRQNRRITLDKVTIGKINPFEVVTSISKAVNLSNESVSIFPNPSETGRFTLSQSVRWTVLNTNGTLVKQGIGDEVDLSGFSKGVYHVVLGSQALKIFIH